MPINNCKYIILPMFGKSITRFIVDFSLSIELGTSQETLQALIKIEGDFVYKSKSSIYRISTDSWGNVEFVFSLLQILVSEVAYHKDGTLSIQFVNDIRIEVPPSSEFESWQVIGMSESKVNFRAVCMPGGEIAIWDDLE